MPRLRKPTDVVAAAASASTATQTRVKLRYIQHPDRLATITMKPLDILIVDDEPLACARARLLLVNDPEVGNIREALGGLAAIDAIETRPPDLVLLDIQMPEI